jgi:hypothetical protein
MIEMPKTIKLHAEQARGQDIREVSIVSAS